MIKALIKKIVPPSILNGYHFCLGWLAAVVYGWPSERLKVIGVTGTSGKSTTVHFLRHLLESAGQTIGALSTVEFYLAGKSQLNDRKMTMLGRFQTQRFLRQAVRAGCDYVIIETTSQGVVQHRQRFINYDVAVLTNLYPEHLEAHGGWANYKAAKLAFFKQVARSRRKEGSPKVAILNGDNQYVAEFALGGFDHLLFFGQEPPKELLIGQIKSSQSGLDFKLNDVAMHLPFFGQFNVFNFAAAAGVAMSQGIKLTELVQPAEKMPALAGHLEFIEAGQPFKVIVDYAFEPVAMSELYKIIQLLPSARVIQVLGSTGGGRDQARRAILGRLAGEKAAVVIVTNEDPYDEDPQAIIDQVAAGAVAAGKKLGENLFTIFDRRQAIARALALTEANNLVLITGKGAEQAICLAGGRKIPWDDRRVVKEELKQLILNNC